LRCIISSHFPVFHQEQPAGGFQPHYSYQTYIPSFDSIWEFLLAVKNHLDPLLPAEDIDRTHLSMFYLPRHLRPDTRS